MSGAAHRPERFPRVPDGFSGPCLIEVEWQWRSGRGRFWRPSGAGYTDDLARAGVYSAEDARSRCSDRCYPIDAVAALEAEEQRLAALRESVRALLDAARAGR